MGCEDGGARALPDRIGERLGDNPDEVFDLVDADDRVLGQVRRGDAHRNAALLHRSVQVLILGSDGRLLLQKRSASKDLFPNYWCASASGHVAAGDDYLTTARREAREELGIEIEPQWLGKVLVRTAPETEWTGVFLARSDGPFCFSPTETDGGQFFTFEEIATARETRQLALTPAVLAAIDLFAASSGP